MAFKIKNFYGSPLYSSSPDRPFTAEDSGDKTTPFLNIRSCKDIQDEINKKQAEIKKMRDLTKKDKKVRNWDNLSDQVDGLKEELKNCKK